MLRFFSQIMFPKWGWLLLHATAVGLLFFLGYSMKF